MTRALVDSAPHIALRRIMRERRSIRRYAGSVPAAVIRELLEAACDAPSAHNRQPWRFAVLSENQKIVLAQTMGARLRVDRLAAGDERAAVELDVARSYERITRAPVAILVSLSMADMDQYPDAARAQAERAMAIQSTAMSVQNVLLLAHARGYGACWMCGPLFCPEAVRHALALPADWEPQALVTVGVPVSPTRPRTRRELGDVARGVELR